MPPASWHAPGDALGDALGNARGDAVVDPTARPHLNCYWLLPGLLLAGEYPAPHLSALLTSGVKNFVDLTDINEGLVDYSLTLPDSVAHKRFAITDFGVPSVALMRQILDAINGNTRANLSTYLHCHGGIGRTGTVAACWLIEQGHTPDGALALLDQKWQVMEKRERAPHTPETPQQVAFIQAWSPR